MKKLISSHGSISKVITSHSFLCVQLEETFLKSMYLGQHYSCIRLYALDQECGAGVRAIHAYHTWKKINGYENGGKISSGIGYIVNQSLNDVDTVI